MRGHDWFTIIGTAQGASGVAVTGAASVQVVRSTVAASTSYTDTTHAWPPNGAAAIDAPQANVMLLDTTVTGGDVGDSSWPMGPPWPTPCPCGTMPGRGGDGVVAHNVYQSGGSVIGGAGSAVSIGVPPVPYGTQPPGVPVTALATTAVAATLVPTPLQLGALHTIAFPPTASPSLLVVGGPLPWPVPVLSMPHWCLDLAQPFLLNFLPPASTSFAIQVPNLTQLLGIELATQRADLGAGGALTATNPTFAVVGP